MINSDRDSIKSVYMIAICGTGMAALAGMLKMKGYAVSGSDQNVYPPMSTFLTELGIPVHSGYKESNLETDPDLVVIGNAMSRGNPEVEIVLEKRLNYISLPQALREFFIRGNYSCVVTGTHGKTSTSSLLAWVLEHAGRDPGFFIGGIPENFKKGYKIGSGKIFVSEGDEYDSAFFDKGAKFLHYLPDLVILNNIEFDHADIFQTFEEIKTCFFRLINLIPRNGYLLAGWDDPTVRELSERIHTNLVTFGLSPDAEWRADEIITTSMTTRFGVFHKGVHVADFEIPLFGRHSVLNTLSVIAAATLLGVTVPEIQGGLTTFKNVKRRLEFKGQVNGIRIFDDFAHHPTEVHHTIDGLKNRFPESKIWAVFEPRTATSRRRFFEQEYQEALSHADEVIITPLYLAEKIPAEERMSVEAVVQALKKNGTSCHLMAPDDSMVKFLKQNAAESDIVLFMSNGDFHQIPERLLNED